MENRLSRFNLSKQVDLKVTKISRRHLLRIIASLGILGALAATSDWNLEETEGMNNSPEVEKIQ